MKPEKERGWNQKVRFVSRLRSGEGHDSVTKNPIVVFVIKHSRSNIANYEMYIFQCVEKFTNGLIYNPTSKIESALHR